MIYKTELDPAFWLDAKKDDHMENRARTPVKNRIQPIVAWRSMQKLLKDKEDTVEVFRVIQALGGGEFERNFKRFENSAIGRAVLNENRNLLSILADRDRLASMPEGSLGRKYLGFVQAEQLTAEGLVAASEEGGVQHKDRGRQLYSARVRDMHDLWHVVTSYGRDGLGELCLLAFSYAQISNLGVGFIILMGTRKGWREFPGSGIPKAVREGYRLGKQANWMPAADWEQLLDRPLDEVRQTLNCLPPAIYRETLGRLNEVGSPEFAETLGAGTPTAV